MRLRTPLCSRLLMFLMVAGARPAHADDPDIPAGTTGPTSDETEFARRIEANEDIDELGPDLMGDSVSLYNGTLPPDKSKRCSLSDVPPQVVGSALDGGIFATYEFWHGVNRVAHGGGGRDGLLRNPGITTTATKSGKMTPPEGAA